MSQTITPQELQARLQAEPATVVLDVRTPAEYQTVHVREARNVPLNSLQPCQLELAAGAPVYLLCQSGTRAQLAEALFTRAGLTQAVVVEGGTAAWVQAGLPVERGAGGAISLERQVRIAAGTLVLTGVLLSLWVHPWFLALSAFVGTGLIFAGITDWCGMGLLLARLPWNQRPA